MSSYHIIDEPKIRFSDKFIVNPLIILFAAILVPLFWTLPFLGRLWMPLVWIIANGIMLGSSTFWKEILAMVVGAVLYVATIYGTSYIANSTNLFADPDVIWPYVRIFLQAIFFITLYVAIFMQQSSYSIFQYIKENR